MNIVFNIWKLFQIQKVWRGYYTRKYISNYYSRKRYLEGLAIKNEIVRWDFYKSHVLRGLSLIYEKGHKDLEKYDSTFDHHPAASLSDGVWFPFTHPACVGWYPVPFIHELPLINNFNLNNLHYNAHIIQSL